MLDPRPSRASDEATSDPTLGRASPGRLEAHSFTDGYSSRGCGAACAPSAAVRYSHDHIALDHRAGRSDAVRQRSTLWPGGRTVLGPGLVAGSPVARCD